MSTYEALEVGAAAVPAGAVGGPELGGGMGLVGGWMCVGDSWDFLTFSPLINQSSPSFVAVV